MTKHSVINNQKITGNKLAISRNLRKNMTEAENVFWQMIRNRKLFNLKFRRQQIIDGFIVDFYCNEIGLIIEIDGSVHDNDEQKYLDNMRSEILKNRGLNILRFNNEDVFNRPEYIVKKIELFKPPLSNLERGRG